MNTEGETVYGIRSWNTWNRDHPDDLTPSRTRVWDVHKENPFPVTAYDELVRIVSFLHVMNKVDVLLFRGQQGRSPLVPTLLRDTWTPPPRSGIGEVPIARHRDHYWKKLDKVSAKVFQMLHDDKSLLPRWHPFSLFKTKPLAAWAVVQHYELWPTPLLDLTSSLRVAASFALGLKNDSEKRARSTENVSSPSRQRSGYLYVLRFDSVVSNLMTLDEGKPADLQAIRLNSVCPPDARRPHYQEGFLLARTRSFDQAHQLNSTESASSRLVAKFKLIDDGRFWTPDFPPHSTASLLPTESDDELQREFGRLKYRLERDVVLVD